MTRRRPVCDLDSSPQRQLWQLGGDNLLGVARVSGGADRPLEIHERASYRRAGGSSGFGSPGMSLARWAVPSGALALAVAAAMSDFAGVRCAGRQDAVAHGRWPGIVSVQSDDAGSSVEREVRCEPALCGAPS